MKLKKFKNLFRTILSRRIRQHRILSGPNKGNSIVTSWYDYPSAILGRNEHALLTWLEANVQQDETWLDIGTHYGYVALKIANLVGETGRVFAFEPMLHTAGAVQKTRNYNLIPQLTITPFALGRSESIELLELSTSRGMIDSTIEQNGWNEQFFASSLDWLWPKICGGDSVIHGIKIDVQGMEIEALHGMCQTLKAHKPKLILETHAGVEREEILAILSSVGYRAEPVPLEHSDSHDKNIMLDDHSYVFYPDQ